MRFPFAFDRRSMLRQLETAACTRSYGATFGTLGTLDHHPWFNLFRCLLIAIAATSCTIKSHAATYADNATKSSRESESTWCNRFNQNAFLRLINAMISS